MNALLSVWLAAQLVLLTLLPGRSLNELAKVPQLMMHYRHHCTEHGKISFIDFLDLHYGNQANHGHGVHHEELPFKTVTADAYFCLTTVVFPRDPGVSPQVSVAATTSTTPIKVAEIVWHPPRG